VLSLNLLFHGWITLIFFAPRTRVLNLITSHLDILLLLLRRRRVMDTHPAERIATKKTTHTWESRETEREDFLWTEGRCAGASCYTNDSPTERELSHTHTHNMWKLFFIAF
jgi:hypothetical protein